MTRSFVVIISIIIVLGLGLHFYTQWETKRFKASLPKPPATKDPAKAENTIENQEKFNPEIHDGHGNGDEWHTTPHVPELASDETQEQSVSEEHSQLVVPNAEASEPIEDPVAIQLDAEKIELEQLQAEVNDMGNRFRSTLEAQSISVDEANAIYEELNHKLQHLRERRYRWLRKYAEHHGTEYQGPAYWANPQMIDDAVTATQEQTEQETQEDALSRGYIIIPRTDP